MNNKRIIFIIISLLAFSLLVSLGCAQRSVQAQRAATPTPDGFQMTVKGTIEYNKSLGGYFVHGLEPGGELFIVNQNPLVLEGLLKGGKTLVIEGRIVKGAEYLYIEKIDGKAYQGKE